LDKIKNAYSSGDEPLKTIKLRALRRRLNGELLPTKELAEAINSNDNKSISDYRFIIVRDKIFIKEVADSNEIDLTNLENDIRSQISEL